MGGRKMGTKRGRRRKRRMGMRLLPLLLLRMARGWLSTTMTRQSTSITVHITFRMAFWGSNYSRPANLFIYQTDMAVMFFLGLFLFYS